MLIAPYISKEEYRCGGIEGKHCGRLPPDLNEPYANVYESLFYSFEKWRKAWGKPIPIRSGYRCPEYNAMIGGEKASVHMFGAALDCDFSTVDEVEAAYKLLDEIFPLLRIGKYTKTGSFIHCDTGYLIFPRASEDWIHGARWFK